MEENTQQEVELLPTVTDQRAFVHHKIKAVNKERREILHMITTPSTDRVGDIIDPKGADISNYLRNPIVLVNHSYDAPRDVIGRALSIEVSDDGITARTQFRDTALARDAFALAAEGLGGWSIGFRPQKYTAIRDEKGVLKGFHFTRWELLEYSLVAIPMNQDIVNNMIKNGVVHRENVPVFVSNCDFTEPSQPAAAASQGTKADSELWSPDPEQYARIVRASRQRKVRELAATIADLVNRYEAGRAVGDLLHEVETDGK